MDKCVSLYIHIPFCVRKCLYCDFLSYSGMNNIMIDYAHALSKEILTLKKRNISTVFIGGGTPTYLPVEAWKIIGESLSELNIKKDAEFTVEGNPGTFNEAVLEYLKSIGVNRISIGLQSWQNRLLKKLGRIHNIDDFMDSYKMARKYGFKNINVDLMFAIPDQSYKDWMETLKNVIDISPEHISCYSLIIEKNTPYYEMNKKNMLNLADEETERSMYFDAVRLLSENGYNQYEISNFSKKGYECKHNLVYWELKDYIGCGLGAHSYDNSVRYKNTDDIKLYIKSPFENREYKKNSIKDNIEEFMFLGLRKTNGISEKEFEEKFKRDVFDVYGDVIDKYKKSKLLIEKDGRIYLTLQGISVSNYILSDFIIS